MTHAPKKTTTARAPMDSMRMTGPRYDLTLDNVGDHARGTVVIAVAQPAGAPA
jgi:hypothetical protein